MSQNEPAVFGLGHLETSIAIDRGDAGCQGGGSGGQCRNSHLDALGARCRLHTRGPTSGSLTQEAGVWERRLDWTRGRDGFRDVGAPGARGTSKGYRRTETRSSGWPTRLPAPARQEPGWWPSQGARRGRPGEGRATPRTTRSGKRLERVSPRTTRRSLRKRSAGFGPESGLSGAPPRDALTPIGLCSAQITE